MGEGDAKSLWPVTNSPAADFKAPVEASADVVDRKEGVLLNSGVRGRSGWSSSVGRPNLAVNVKVEPFPGIADPSILPPCSSTSCRDITKPRPLPPCWRVLLP